MNPSVSLRGWVTVVTVCSLALTTACGHSHTSQSAIGSFAATGNMQNERFALASTRIVAGPLSGRILVTGGITSGNVATATAELYDPGSGTFSPAGEMTTARAYHTATALDDGTVLVVGGVNSDGLPLNSAELFNPETNTFSAVAPLDVAVWQHVAVPFCVEHSGVSYLYSMLTTGAGGGVCPAGYVIDVFIAGGFTDKAGKTPSGQASIYDPATQVFTPVASMPTPLAAAPGVLFPSMTADSAGIPEPDILIAGGTGAGGTSVKVFELYPLGGLSLSPYGGNWQVSPSLGLTNAVSYATATALENEPTKLSPCDGFVVIAGGQPIPSGATSDLFYLYQPGAEGQFGTILGTGTMQEARVHHTATLLDLVDSSVGGAGKLLVAGGEQNTPDTAFSSLDTAETYTPAVRGKSCSIGSFTLTRGDMTTPRWYHAAESLGDGTARVLLVGGSDSTELLSSAEIFTP
jgi:Galactose oxidase, central domain